MSWTLEFYRSANESPVADWLDSLPPAEAARALSGLDILRSFGTQLAMPHVREIEGGLRVFGLRQRGQPEHRVFYVEFREQRLLILHGCTKEAPGTPPADVAIARQRHQTLLARAG